MNFDSVLNAGEYLSNYYLEELLPDEVRKRHAGRWNESDRAGEASPRKRLLELRSTYPAARAAMLDSAEADPVAYRESLGAWHRQLLTALGYEYDPRPHVLVRRGQERPIDLAYQSKTTMAVDCEFRSLASEAADLSLVRPLQEGFDSAAKLAQWLFGIDEHPPKYVLLLCGGVVVIADSDAFLENRYLAVSVDTVLERADKTEAGIAAAFTCAEVLEPQDEADPGRTGLGDLVDQSGQQAQGVSKSLREGLRRSVEIIAREVLDRLREQDFDWTAFYGDREFADRLTAESLRYLYRILFLLFAEARPELEVLPAESPEYQAGYSIARLGRTVERELRPESYGGTYLYESLELLFNRINDGYRFEGEQGQIVFEPLQSELFDPSSVTLIGQNLVPDPETEYVWEVDTRIRNKALHQVLRLLMIDDGTLSGKRGRGKRTQFVSYRTLGTEQLGAVYEGLMSYTGRIARGETLYEVAQAKDLKDHDGQPKDGSWLIPESALDDYPDKVKVSVEDPFTGRRSPVAYPDGSFVYRLAGRDRQTSASYYTPKSLTETTVQLTVDQMFKERDGEITAEDVLNWRILEPALGSGNFLNEAIDQVARKYLDLRQTEVGEEINAEQFDRELRKVKAYIALHNAYGVDLNATAVELAEISIWLNVMYPGLKSPWFGLHLRQGNSLIGGRREVYQLKDLSPNKNLKVKPKWWELTPIQVKLGEVPAGEIETEQIHHFLLPSAGWGAVADHKETKQWAAEDAKALANWRRGLLKRLNPGQAKRAQRLAKQVEYLWSLVAQRLALSEQAVARDIDLWHAPDSIRQSGNSAIIKEEVLRNLVEPGGPYWRLKKLMDTWCALWFWPTGKHELLIGPAEAGPQPGGPGNLASLDDWFDYCEALVGRTLPGEWLGADGFRTLEDLAAHESDLHSWMDMKQPFVLEQTDQLFAFTTEIERIVEKQRFFHWELQFAHVFAEGGFDLQVGNPPWYRPVWDSDAVMSELDPHFLLDRWNDVRKRERKEELLRASARNLDYFLAEATVNAGLSVFVGHRTAFDLLEGTQPNLYRCFMMRTWGNASEFGCIGLVHPDSHLGGVKEGALRSATYRHLRVHAHFTNERKLFEDLNHTEEYGLHVYGPEGAVSFDHLSWIFEPSVVTRSLNDDGEGMLPGIKVHGSWDTRPHSARVVSVDAALLAEWNRLSGASADSDEQAKILYPVTTAELGPIAKFAAVAQRFGNLNPDISSGFHESADKKAGYFEDIDKATGIPDADKPAAKAVASWSEVILQGPHFTISTSLAKMPRTPLENNQAWDALWAPELRVDTRPLTNYRRSVPIDQYRAKQDQWVDHDLWEDLKSDPAQRDRVRAWLLEVADTPAVDVTDDLIDAQLRTESLKPYTNFWRVAWREMIPSDGERVFHAALLPPGPAHVDTVHSGRSGVGGTVVQVGFWSSLLLDYYLRVTGSSHLKAGQVRALPVESTFHPLSKSLILRTLRLNCLTDVYAPLWEELYDAAAFAADSWAFPWPGLQPLDTPGPKWTRGIPLRTDFERRAALIEIDAIAAVMLGITADELKTIYSSRFAVLSGREEQTWFDANGDKLCGDTKAAGYKQAHTTDALGKRDPKLPFTQLAAYLADPSEDRLPSGFPRFSESSGLAYYRANRLGMEPDEEYPDGVNGNAAADTLGEYAVAHAEFTRRLDAMKSRE